jgi:hypothetical protein
MTYQQILKSLQEYFANLIILQYRNAPKNRSLIYKLVNLIFANNLALQIRDLTVDVDKSEGKQLDVVGKWVGIDRYYNGSEIWEHPYLSFPLYSQIKSGVYDDVQGGFSTYTNFADNNGGFLTYKQWQDIRTTQNTIGDGYFRSLIKLKIIKNSINHTCKNIDNAIWAWSDGNVYTTWATMQVTYNYTSSYKMLMTLAVYKDVLPRPTGCTVIVQEIQ